MPRTQLSLEIDPDLLRRLKMVAIKESKSVSEIVRGLVGAYVTKKEAESV